MKNTKRTLALVLALVMMLAAMSVPALAANEKAGDIIKLGGINWRILEVQDGKALIISENILEARPFHPEFAGDELAWEVSEMRKYLNGDFYNKFNADEKAKIVESRLVNHDNPEFGTSSGNDTTDRIFCLSANEAGKYFKDEAARTAVTLEGNDYHWWLRTTGAYSMMTYVQWGGSIRMDGSSYTNGDIGIRPAMWINLSGGTTAPPTTAPNIDSASSWARDGINDAYAKGFIPDDIQSNYTNIITRQEFCRMAVKWLEYRLGKGIDAIVAEKGDPAKMGHTFSDTTDANILAAYRLGITGGTSAPADGKPGLFNPSGQFSREQAATMIRNTCRAAGMDVSNVADAGFTDMINASSWAVDGINFVRNAGIMQGTRTSPPMFDPEAQYTREQSIITFNNIQ